eukprot:TRINITY_DN17504_c0_g1_i2.p1 TRINITY_DN17504_c0_g1~~TRINITY_DN17504_c0_g1_i2.p1  ORF type:complete len:297 (+),score=24.81 TRINITY_DN17504_c0_g1_i2:96-893(+)
MTACLQMVPASLESVAAAAGMTVAVPPFIPLTADPILICSTSPETVAVPQAGIAVDAGPAAAPAAPRRSSTSRLSTSGGIEASCEMVPTTAPGPTQMWGRRQDPSRTPQRSPRASGAADRRSPLPRKKLRTLSPTVPFQGRPPTPSRRLSHGTLSPTEPFQGRPPTPSRRLSHGTVSPTEPFQGRPPTPTRRLSHGTVSPTEPFQGRPPTPSRRLSHGTVSPTEPFYCPPPSPSRSSPQRTVSPTEPFYCPPDRMRLVRCPDFGI